MQQWHSYLIATLTALIWGCIGGVLLYLAIIGSFANI